MKLKYLSLVINNAKRLENSAKSFSSQLTSLKTNCYNSRKKIKYTLRAYGRKAGNSYYTAFLPISSICSITHL